MSYFMEHHVDVEVGRQHLRNGFSLLELLLVVALIGILAAFAVPTYKTYLQKTRFMEVVQHSHAVRVAQSACLLQVGDDLIACDTFAELAIPSPNSSNNMQSITLASTNGKITGTGTTAAGGYTFTLTPSINDAGLLTYAIGGSCVAVGFCGS
jgi:prepilin-type N-terminal cleavage/methylation domain-containing protein